MLAPSHIKGDEANPVFAELADQTRAPSWNFSDNTLQIVQDLGFLYESSLMADDRPYELLSGGEPTDMVELIDALRATSAGS